MPDRNSMLLNFIFLLVPALLLAPVRSDKMKRCPDQSPCPETGTCCKLQSGRYSCCMLKNAVCCTTRSSCCPENYVCAPSSNLCAAAPIGHKTTASTSPFAATMMSVTQTPIATAPRREVTVPAKDDLMKTATVSVNHTPIATEPPREVTVPFEDHLMQKCPVDDAYCFKGNNTCCRFGSLSAAPDKVTFGCCPDKDAVCCTDLINCCPKGFYCIGNTGTCGKTAPITRSGDLLPLRLQQDAPFNPPHVSAMRIEAGRQRPYRPVVVKN